MWQFFNSFGVVYFPKEMKKFIGNKNITTNIYRIQEYDSVIRGYLLYRIYWFYDES